MTSNKDLFLAAFARFAAGDHDVLREIIRPDFIEHSPGNPSGRDAWVDYIKNSPVATAQMNLKRVIADDDHVVVHYEMVDGPEATAVVDIWRFDDGLIAEHWDVVQPVPAPTEIPNGMF
jgi:predicted SnoaL-like aldol condensation-catalyzing enzyme